METLPASCERPPQMDQARCPKERNGELVTGVQTHVRHIAFEREHAHRTKPTTAHQPGPRAMPSSPRIATHLIQLYGGDALRVAAYGDRAVPSIGSTAAARTSGPRLTSHATRSRR